MNVAADRRWCGEEGGGKVEIDVTLGSWKLLLQYKFPASPEWECAPRWSEQLFLHCLSLCGLKMHLCLALLHPTSGEGVNQCSATFFTFPFSNVPWPSLLDWLGCVYYGGLNSKLHQKANVFTWRCYLSQNLPVQLVLLINELLVLVSLKAPEVRVICSVMCCGH